MTINLEQIDLLRQRTNASYEEAKEALEKNNYDPVEALIYLERQKKTKPHQSIQSENNLGNTIKQLWKKGNETKFTIKKSENTVLNVPVNVAVISTVIFPPITVVGVAAALLTHHNIKLEKKNGEDVDINKSIEKVTTAVTTAASQVVDNINRTE